MLNRRTFFLCLTLTAAALASKSAFAIPVTPNPFNPCQTPGAGVWFEQGDAGGLFDAQATGSADPLTAICGTLGDTVNNEIDKVDVFGFAMKEDGTLSAFAFFYLEPAAVGTPLPSNLLPIPYLSVYEIGSNQPIDDLVSESQINIDLDAGEYLLKIAIDDEIDPPFSFELVGPTTGLQTIVYPSVPEPATLALLGLGFGAIGYQRRRRLTA